MLLIAGKFDPGLTLRWVYRAFGKMPKPTRKMLDFWTFEPLQDGERSVTVRRQGDVQIVAVAYKIPSERHTDTGALSHAGTIPTNTPNGRLHKSLVETGKATAVFNYEMTGYAPGLEIIARRRQ